MTYGHSTLADVAPSVLASLGVEGEPNILGLEPTRHAWVLLIDGLGWDLLRDHPDDAPFLGELVDSGRSLTAGFPTTTATSLTSLGTGRPPGHHGIVGYQVAIPGTDQILNQLLWEADVDPRRWQPHRTAFQRAEAAGVHASYVAASAFRDSDLTQASARGGHYRPADGFTELVIAARESARAADRSYTFVYHSHLDAVGHLFGVDSQHWRTELAFVDRLVERLAHSLPRDGVLYVVADHGMVDVPGELKFDVESDRDLAAGVRVLAGEARMRHVYAHPGATDDVLAAWRERFADRALVLGREEAIAAGWFGPVESQVRPRIGDVLAVALGETAFVAPLAEPTMSSLVGMHGSLTTAESRVPLLRVRGDAR
ncbi:alkaline phosphatase family protein [Spiractinospora alimapuensis]|uniref:alkaline phosphatase family protein n=1 Tax=Spiractinospora alimapuensis TaxID=2820884 RepID=UPI002ECFD1DD